MASGSGSGKVYKPYSSYNADIAISFNETGTSVSNNTSTISVNASITANGSLSWNVSGSGVLRAYWHDNHKNADILVAENYFNELGYSNNSRSANGTIVATHNDDGTLSGYAICSFVQLKQYNNYVPNSGSCRTPNTALTTIARKSSPTTSVSEISIPASSGSFTVNTNRKSGSFTHTITLKVGSTTIATRTGVGASTTFNLADIDDSILATIPNASSATLTVNCETFNGSTSIGSNSTTMTVRVNDNAKPTFSDFDYSDTNSAITAITGDNQVLLSGKSTLTATISTSQKATANYSATMANYTFSINGVSQSQTYTTNAITKNLGTVTLSSSETANTVKSLVVMATDSRGKSTSVSKDITVIPYNEPIINATAVRQNGFESNTTISISGRFSPILVNGTAKNDVSTTTGVKFRYKNASTSTWGSWQNKTATVNRTNGTVTVADFVASLDFQSAWNVEIQLTDKLSTTTIALLVSVGQPAFFIGDDGRVAVGGMPTIAKTNGEQGLLEVFGSVYAKNLRSTGNAYANGNRLAELPITSDDVDWATVSGGVWSTFVCSNPSTAVRNVNVRTKLGTPLTLHIENGGTTFRVDSGAQNIMLVRQFWSARFQKTNTDAPGVNGLVKNSTIYTYVYGKGDNNAVSGCATEFRQTDNNQTYGALLLARGAKNSATNECIIQRTSPNSLLWHIHGKYLVEGSDSFASYSSQVTAGSTSNIPTVYQRSVGLSGMRNIYNVLEVFEMTDPVD